MSSNSVLEYIAPAFQPYIQDVYQDLNLGLCKSQVSIERIGGVTHKADSQFRLVFPYCSKQLRWEVLFDLQSPWYAPDFRFDDDAFISGSEDDLDRELPSLAEWDGSNPRSLSKVLMELIQLYKNYQIKKLMEDDSSRAHFEYSSLVARTPASDIQVWVGERGAEFLIRLRVDVARLPELYNESLDENPGLDSALLLVRYPHAAGAELLLSPFLTAAVGPVALPPMYQHVLFDYVPMVTDYLNHRIQAVLTNTALKRSLLAHLSVRHEAALLERADDAAAFLFSRGHYYWLLHVELASTFPEKPPTITIRSVYDKVKGKPRTKVLTNCPYDNFEAYIEEQVDIFKNEGIDIPNQNHSSRPHDKQNSCKTQGSTARED